MQENTDLTSRTISDRLVNVTSAEVSALLGKVQASLEIAKVLVRDYEMMRSLLTGLGSCHCCQYVTCCTGNNFHFEKFLQAFNGLAFAAHQLVAQIEEVAAALSVLQERVGRIGRSDASAMTINNL